MALIQDDVRSRIIETTRQLINEKHVEKITVRDVLKELNLTNRVFYNRFRNIDEVLEILYQEDVQKVRAAIFTPFSEGDDFERYIERVAVDTLVRSYERQQHMSRYIFEIDSGDSRNYEWWCHAIRQIIEKGKDLNYFKPDLNEDALSYSIWCYIRGFNTDAVARKWPKDEAVKTFTYGLRCFLAGAKA